LPFTRTRPLRISSSAALREAIPAWLKIFWSLSFWIVLCRCSFWIVLCRCIADMIVFPLLRPSDQIRERSRIRQGRQLAQIAEGEELEERLGRPVFRRTAR
jgi:hypothetical protein